MDEEEKDKLHAGHFQSEGYHLVLTQSPRSYMFITFLRLNLCCFVLHKDRRTVSGRKNLGAWEEPAESKVLAPAVCCGLHFSPAGSGRWFVCSGRRSSWWLGDGILSLAFSNGRSTQASGPFSSCCTLAGASENKMQRIKFLFFFNLDEIKQDKITSSPNSHFPQETRGFHHFQNSDNLLFGITF